MATVRIEKPLSVDEINNDIIWVCNDINMYYDHQYRKRYGQSVVWQLNPRRRLIESEIQQLEMGECPVCPE